MTELLRQIHRSEAKKQAARRLSVLLLPFLISSCVQPVESELNPAGNRSPVIKALRALPPSIIVGTWTSVEVEAEDPDGDPLSVQWYANAGDIIGSGSKIRYTASYCCVGVNYVRTTVMDNRGGSSVRSIDIQVLQ